MKILETDNHPIPVAAVTDMKAPSTPISMNASMVWLLAALLYFLFAASTIHLTSDGRTIATVWPANAVLLAMLLLDGRPRWGLVLSAGLVANVAANWLTRGTMAGALLYSMANGVEIGLAAMLVRAGGRRFDALRSPQGLLRFLIAAGLISPLVSGLLGASTAVALFAEPFTEAFTVWLLSDSLGLLIFTPMVFAVFSGELADTIAQWSWRERAVSAAILLSVALTTYAVFFVAALPALFLLYAPVMLVTFRIGPLGTNLAVIIIAVMGAFATARGHGPVVMIQADALHHAHMLQIFLAVVLLTCLPVAAGLAEQRRLAAELARREREAKDQAATDPLTGVLNRRGFALAAAEWSPAELGQSCCVAIDVDRFKDINDRWGHGFGDRVLCHLATTLRAQAQPGDLIGRLGGDEFLMLVRTDQTRSGEAFCARVQAALRQTPVDTGEQVQVMVSISLGLAAGQSDDTVEQLSRRADSALYAAKKAGRNTVRRA